MYATEQQVRYAMYLMSEKGYSTEYMRGEHKSLGASMRERSGRVADWLSGMTMTRISELIDMLKKM